MPSAMSSPRLWFSTPVTSHGQIRSQAWLADARRLGLAACLAPCAASSLHAQEVAAPAASSASAASQVVEVAPTVRNPAMMPYRKACDLLAKVDKAGAHRLHAVFRVTSQASHQAMPDLRVAIEGEKTHLQVPVSSTGLIELPVDPSAYADDADLVANKPKQTLAVDFFVVPELPAGNIRYADLAQSASTAQAAVSQIVPWYLRLLMPSIKGVGLCYPDAGHAVAIEGAAQAMRAADVPADDVAGNKVFCARFPEEETSRDVDRRVVPQDGWEALFW